MAAMCNDLAAEKASLREVLADLDEAAWDTPTPSPSWVIRDQVSHLAYFDEKASLALRDPDAFLAELTGDAARRLFETHLEIGRALPSPQLLEWWDEANAALCEAYRDVDPKQRIVWYGPPMAARSKVTARIMETWAHGQDVWDALEMMRPASPRLYHVCHIGVRARPFAYIANGLPPPEGDVHVALLSPEGETWEWGDPAAADRVCGSALGFALLVTQRRHRRDVDLIGEGSEAERWLGIAQAFAGPPGEGRRPGQFSHLDDHS